MKKIIINFQIKEYIISIKIKTTNNKIVFKLKIKMKN